MRIDIRLQIALAAISLALWLATPEARAAEQWSVFAVETGRVVDPFGLTGFAGADLEQSASVEDSTEPVSVSIPRGSASASTSQLSASASAIAVTRFEEVLGDPVGRRGTARFNGQTEVRYGNDRFTLDPAVAGVAARLIYSVTLAVGGSPQSIDPPAPAGGGGSAFGSVDGVSFDSSSELSSSGERDIPFGRFVEMHLFASAGAFTEEFAIVNGQFVTLNLDASGSASATVDFQLVVLEDRLHWTSPATTIQPSDPAQWAENLALSPTRYATFNRTTPRNLALTLGQGSEWRGLIVDGETLGLDLNLATLRLGRQSESVKDFNIILGEGRSNASHLTLRDGTAIIEKGILVGGNTSGASLTLDQGLTVESEDGLVTTTIVGRAGNATLTVKNGSELSTSALVIAENAGVTASAEVTGAGSRLHTAALVVGREGVGSLVVKDGATLESQTFSIGLEGLSDGTLRLEGTGTRYLLGQVDFGQGVSPVGKGGAGLLHVSGGARIVGRASPIEVGAGLAGVNAQFTVTGDGSGLDSALVTVENFARFELLNNASASELGLQVRAGGQATFDNAAVEGLQFLVGGELAIRGGSDTIATRLTVQPGGLIEVAGAGTKLRDFQSFEVRGILDVSDGAEVIAGSNELGPAEINFGSEGFLTGSGGTVRADVFVSDGRVGPGRSPGILTIDGDLTLLDGSVLELEIGGIGPGTQHDQLIVTGALDLSGGEVEVAFTDGFAPQTGQEFALLVSAGFSGTPQIAVTGLAPGWQFNTHYDPATNELALLSLTDGVPNAGGQPLAITVHTFSPPPEGTKGTSVSTTASGPPGAVVRLEASGDFDQWTTLTTATIDGSGNLTFQDVHDPLAGDRRFYRVTSP